MVEVKKYLNFKSKILISLYQYHPKSFAKESTSAMCQCLKFLNRIFPFKFNNIFLLNINPLGAGPDFFQIILRGLRRKGGGGR